MQVERRGWRESTATVLLVVIGAVALYEAAIAIQVIPIGDEPGENALGGGAARAVGTLALLGALVVAVASIRTPELLSGTVRLLLPLAGASLVVATGYAFDPYFAPTLRRYADPDNWFPSTWWLFFVAAAAVVAGLLSRVNARVGLGATALVLLICLPTLLYTGIGH